MIGDDRAVLVAEILDELGDRVNPAGLAAGLPEIFEALLGSDPEIAHTLQAALMAAPTTAERLLDTKFFETAAESFAGDVEVTLQALRKAGHLGEETLDRLEVAPAATRLRACVLCVGAARDQEEEPPIPRNHHRNPWWCFCWDALLERSDELHAEPFAVS